MHSGTYPTNDAVSFAASLSGAGDGDWLEVELVVACELSVFFLRCNLSTLEIQWVWVEYIWDSVGGFIV